MASPELPDQLTELQQAAASLHELWLTYMAAGFPPDAALYLVGCVVGGKSIPPSGASEQT
jgi:hypothetical protein